MDFTEVVDNRRSIRLFDEKEVDDATIDYVLDSARKAPSWANKQCWRFIVIKNKDTISEIAKTMLINRWVKTAPCLIVACADPTDSGTHNDIAYYTVDVAIAFEHLVLAATNKGLGTCWIAGFSEKKIKELLEIPPRIRVVALTPLGYPVEQTGVGATLRKTILRPTARKSLAELVHHERW